MATDTELLAALKAAHDAGDESGAIKIAQMMSAQPATHEPVPAVPDNTTHVTADPSELPGGSNWMAKYGPTSGMSGPQKFMAGMGQSIYDTGRGISQMFGGQTAKDTDEQRQMDAPLMRTGAGLLGNIAGGVAQFALPGMGAEAAGAKIASKLATNPGALRAAQAIYRIASPAATGATFGATGTVGSNETRLGNTGRGAVAGEVGGIAGDAAGTVLRAGEDSLSRGARIGADIAKKYNVPLSMPPLAGGFTGWVGSALDKLPFSGSQERAEGQKNAFNSAMGDISGVDTEGGPMNMEQWQQGRQKVGSNIGAMAQGTTAFVTPAEVDGVNSILHDANTIGTEENAKIVNNWANRLFGPSSKAVPINNPLPGAPVMQIPGDAWRQQNTALNNHIARTDDGDLVHYLSGLQGHYFDALQHGMPPDKVDLFQDLRKQYSNALTIRPLVEKAGSAGINPNLVMNRALTEGNAFAPSGKLNDIGELGQLGKEQLTSKYADSGTAQRGLIYSGLAGLGGAGLNEVFGGNEGENQHNNSVMGAMAPIGGAIAGGLLGRAMHSRPVSAYYTARLPQNLARYVNAGTSTAPVAAEKLAADASDAAPPDQPMADGGQPDDAYQKSSFWDLVKQAYHEITGTPNPAPAPVPGTQASGTVGSDFDSRIDRAVQEQGG